MSETARPPIPYGMPWLSAAEREAAAQVLAGPILTHGPQGNAFAKEFAAFLGGGTCVTTSSCMASLHLAALHLGLKPGDEVIVPAQTHVATVHAVEICGATPVFVDCRPETGNIDPDSIRAAVTPRTRAIILVHFIGIPAAMDEIMAIAGRHGLTVVEDCATGVGSRWHGTHVGLVGDIGCFSFYPTKHMTTAEGGMFVSRHDMIAHRVERLRAFHVDRSYAERTMPGLYDVNGVGLNYRMSEVHAAIGRAQLGRIDDILGRRRANFDRLKQGIGGLAGLRVLDNRDPASILSPYTFSVVLLDRLAARRDDLARRLNAAGIGTSVHYPHPVPRLQYYRDKYGYDPARFPHAAEISDCSINLPVGPHVDRDAAEYIVETFKSVLGALS